ncbi:MAG: proline--tRNA ligase [Dictyoglomi bacterium]|nr:proline--tRNA ligase [Dictyoglomota bacterium]
MRMSRMLIPTLREDPADAESISHKLLVRAGYIRKISAGIYAYLPLAWRVLKKIEDIVREEMDAIGGQEVLMSILMPKEMWDETGRWDLYGDEMFKTKDRKGRWFCLGPTHEEQITALVRDNVSSYKQLPVIFYQINTKFRDELRPRFGVIRGREFIMKDAYSFHTSVDDLKKTYDDMYRAYSNIFRRVGLDAEAFEADSGAIGGKMSHEFLVPAEYGESEVVKCEKCGYKATIEVAHAPYKKVDYPPSDKPIEKVHTPGTHTIEQLAEFLGVEPSRIIKSMLYMVDGKIVMVLIRGDYEVNETKLAKVLDASEVRLLTPDELDEMGLVKGYISPYAVKDKDIKIIADESVQDVKDGVIGADETDYHYIHFNIDEFDVEYVDIRQVNDGDACPVCGAPLKRYTAIEVGHIFNLGTRYSEPMGATYLDENGQRKPYIMGCYGIGISRVMATIVERSHDENGIIWPISVAPYHVIITVLDVKKDDIMTVGEEIYKALTDAGIETILDDRDLRPGVKFKDADLIGIPFRIVVSKKTVSSGEYEIKDRKTGEVFKVSKDEIVPFLREKIYGQ